MWHQHREEPWLTDDEGCRTLYRINNMYNSEMFKGLAGTIVDYSNKIEIFLGTIYQDASGDTNMFMEYLNKVWLHEFMHKIVRWEIYLNKLDSAEKGEKEEERMRTLIGKLCVI